LLTKDEARRIAAKGSGRENVINHEGDRRANRCNGQLRADGKYQPVPVHRPVK